VDATPQSFGALKYNPLIGSNPQIDPSKAFSFIFNYQNIARIEVMMEYKKSVDGKKRNFLSKPVFKSLTEKMYNAKAGQTVLCRLVRHTDTRFIKPFQEKFMELPFYNEYFFLQIGGNASSLGQGIIKELPSIKETAKGTAESINSPIPADAVNTVNPPSGLSDAGDSVELGSESASPIDAPPKAGGGY